MGRFSFQTGIFEELVSPFLARAFVAGFRFATSPDKRIRVIVGFWRDVAQLGSAAGLGPVGRRFESCRPEVA